MSISTQQMPIDTGIGRKPEATEVMENIDLSGKTAVVTGGYSGIGIETVRALTNAGATVLVPSRDVERAIKTLEGIIPAEQIGFMDLSNAYPVINLAIFNAGVMACPLDRTQQGLEWQLGVNHVGILLCCKRSSIRCAQPMVHV